MIDVCTILSTPAPTNYDGAVSGCSSAGNKLLVMKSYFVQLGLARWQESQSSQKSVWVGKYEEVRDHPVTAGEMWVEGGQEVEEECVMADKDNQFKWTRVSCSASASYFCEPVSADCPEGYSSISTLGDSRCFKLGDSTHVDQTNNQHVSSILTANKICLEDGARLATTTADAERDAMMTFASGRDKIQSGEERRDLRVFTGLQYFKQSDTIPASCSSCSSLPAWQDGFISPWSDSLISKADGQAGLGSFFTEARRCFVIKYIASTGTIGWEGSSCVMSQQSSEGQKVYPLCEVRKCGGCVFPFILAGRKYNTCVRVGTADGSAWCSTQVDQAGHHVPGSSQPCPADCPLTDCPVGFRPHLKTCIQESASSPEDDPLTVVSAEEECLFQGGRLYQPRSTRTLEAAKVIIPRVYNGARAGDPLFGIHSWASEDPALVQNIGLGMEYRQETLYYRDGSRVPAGLVSAKLDWRSGHPTSDTNHSCVTLQNIDQLTNTDCDFSDKSQASLSYICEARPATTVEGLLENPGQACVFPFRLRPGGEWRHSCVYDPLPDNRWDVWCPTQVDTDGVVLLDSEGVRQEGTVGDCEDERNTVYDGPDADNTCKMPFFFDGRWYENCTLYPRDDYWCATKVDPVTREMVDPASDWGYCPDHLYDKTEECSENYDRLEDTCIRISPYRLSWDGAEEKCQAEGGHLLSIQSESLQFKLLLLIKKKESIKNFFEVNKWSTKELEGYWIGGTVIIVISKRLSLDRDNLIRLRLHFNYWK